VSRVDDLIRQLCPNGVPFKALGDFGTFFDRFFGLGPDRDWE
jgi:hypothetical protein